MYGHCLTRTSWCRSYIFIMIVCILLATTRYYIYKFNFNFNNISKHEDIDEAYSNFENSIIKTLDKHAPIKVALYKDFFPPIFHLKTAVTFLILHQN